MRGAWCVLASLAATTGSCSSSVLGQSSSWPPLMWPPPVRPPTALPTPPRPSPRTPGSVSGLSHSAPRRPARVAAATARAPRAVCAVRCAALCNRDGVRDRGARRGDSSMAPLPKRVIDVCGHELSVVMFIDLRPTATNAQRQAWLFQTELEALLFGGDVIGRTGALYRLLNRSGVGNLTLALRRTSVGQGLLSDSEFDELRGQKTILSKGHVSS